MSAKHALLGLLLHGSAYPYQLADRLETRLGPAWAVNSGQLYQTIERLERDGLIERVEGSGQSRDDRHVFQITESGVTEFERWFDATTGGVRLYRRPLLVKITLAGPKRLREALGLVDAYELECAARLNELLRTRDEVPLHGSLVRADHVLLRLNLSADISQLEGELQWARHAREMVSWLLAQEAIWPSTAERSGAVSEGTRDRKCVRKELFDKMAAKHMQAGSDELGQVDG